MSNSEEQPFEANETSSREEDRGNGARHQGGRTSRTVGVRYGAMHWVGAFNCRANLELRCDQPVVIQTDRGIELGEVVPLLCPEHPHRVRDEQIDTYVQESGTEFYRPRAGRVLRNASEQDVNEHRRLNAHSREYARQCAALAHEHELDIKVVVAEHLLGGERIVFYFRAESRVDFRELVKDLARQHRTRIEMRQVGARDEARLVADFEVCGCECCCRNFLKKLRPVNMKMAKLQKSTLDPSKVSGRCGRLRCCLRYEHEGYEELLKRLPRLNSFVETEDGVGQVIDRQTLTQLVLVRMSDTREVSIPLEEIRAFDVAPPPPPEEREPRETRGTAGRRTERPERPKRETSERPEEEQTPSEETLSGREKGHQAGERKRGRRRPSRRRTGKGRRDAESRPKESAADGEKSGRSGQASGDDSKSDARRRKRRRRPRRPRGGDRGGGGGTD